MVDKANNGGGMNQEKKWSSATHGSRSYSHAKGGLDLIVDMAVRIWQLKNTLLRENPDTVELKKKRSWTQLNRMINQLEQSGVIIQDKTGDKYDTGLSVKVIASEPRGDLYEDTIIETISPTILCNGNIARFGEIIVGVPTTSQNNIKQGDKI